MNRAEEIIEEIEQFFKNWIGGGHKPIFRLLSELKKEVKNSK